MTGKMRLLSTYRAFDCGGGVQPVAANSSAATHPLNGERVQEQSDVFWWLHIRILPELLRLHVADVWV